MSGSLAASRPELVAYSLRGLAIAEQAGWESFDPFDALACPLGNAVRRRSGLAARMVVQAGMRTGPLARRLVGVRVHSEAKAFADMLAAACALGEEGGATIADQLADLLIRESAETPHGRGWGLSFPYASRFVRVEARTPNAYTTAAAVSALLDAAESTGRDELLAAALEGLSFATNDLGWIRRKEGAYLRYWPGADTPITNVQATLASVAIRAAVLGAQDQLRQVADTLASSVVAAQREDGSWRYSEDGAADFVDSFHSGFILEGLQGYLARAGDELANAVGQALEAGYRHFRSHLLQPSTGLPLATSDGEPTNDPQSVAQCAETLGATGHRDDLKAALRTFQHFPHLEWERLVRPRGVRRSDFLSLRWDVGPAVLAAARLSQDLRRAVPAGAS